MINLPDGIWSLIHEEHSEQRSHAPDALQLDSSTFLSLALQHRSDNSLGPAGPSYEQIFLKLAAINEVENPSARANALRLIPYASSLIAPLIDCGNQLQQMPGAFVRPPLVAFNLEPPPAAFDALRQLAGVVCSSPIARAAGLALGEYERTIATWATIGRIGDTGRRRTERDAVLEMLVFEAVSVFYRMRRSGARCAAGAFESWPRITDASNQETIMMLQLWFENAIWSPQPRNIEEAFELREHPRVEKWRTQMHEWTTLMSQGRLSTRELTAAISEANDYIEGARFASKVVPWWATAVLAPVTAVATALGHEWVAAGATLVKGLKLYGTLVKLGVEGDNPLKYGWYLLHTKG